MNSQPNSLFSDLSPESASQSKGGHGGYYSNCHHTVRVRYYPVRYTYQRSYSSYGYDTYRSNSRSINISNLDVDDGAIVNF